MRTILRGRKFLCSRFPCVLVSHIDVLCSLVHRCRYCKLNAIWVATWIVVGLWMLGTTGILSANLRIQAIYLMPVHKLMYPASVLERAATSCGRAIQDTATPPIITRQPLTDSLVVTSPDQSASTYAVEQSVSPGSPYLKPKCLVLEMYFKNRCTGTQWNAAGLSTNFAGMHMDWARSGPVPTIECMVQLFLYDGVP